MFKFIKSLVVWSLFMSALVYGMHLLEWLVWNDFSTYKGDFNVFVLGAWALLLIVLIVDHGIRKKKRIEAKKMKRAFIQFYLKCETTVEERALPNEWVQGTPEIPLTVWIGHLDTPIGKAVFVGMREQQVLDAFDVDKKALATRYYNG